MAKKKSWFNLVKRLFTFDSHSKPEKKEKRWKWVFARLKVKRLASIAAPSHSEDRGLSEAEEEQSKQEFTVAVVTATAFEAAQVAAEVVNLAGTPQSTHQCEEETEELAVHLGSPQSVHCCDREVQELAAIKIQTAFRGLLARKALRALKGIVRLQAIIRGRLVRRQAITTLKGLQSIVNIQSQVCAKRNQMAEGTWNYSDNRELQTLRDKIIKMDANSRRWDDSVLTKEMADALILSKKEAMIKRERIKEYWFSHRKSAESERRKVGGRWRYWLEQWVDTQLSKSKELEDLDTVLTTTNHKPREEYRIKKPKLKGYQAQYDIEGLDSPISAAPRKPANHRRQCSLGRDDGSFSGSPVFPAYMAATESAKAKLRSLSSPRIRSGSFDTYSESYSPCKNRFPLVSSVVASQVPNNGRIGCRPSAYQLRSPGLKSMPGPVKSSRTLKDLSIDSEFSFLTWDRQSPFR